MRLSRLPYLLLPLLLAACAISKHPDRPRAGEIAATCNSKAQCELLWQRSRQWVESNSKQQIKNATDWMILTEEPGNLDAILSYQVMRWPGPVVNGEETGEIRFEATCSYFLPCRPAPAKALEDFSAFVKAP